MAGLHKRLMLLLSLWALLALLPTVSLACGGFFCTNSPIDQGAERIIFTVNGDGTITAVVGINYVGAAADFSWVVPVPSPPALDVAETVSIDTLAQITNVQFTNPPNPCANLYFADIGMGGGGGDGYLVEGSVGPYDYAIIRNESPGEMVAWLRDNGYQITEEMVPIIAQYVEEEMYFLAMKLSQEAEVGDIVPVVMTYEDTEPMIPIRLTAVAAVPDMPIVTWIFADTQYVPANYVHAEVDYSIFRAPHQVAGIGKTMTRFFGFSPMSQYNSQQNAIQDRYRGLAFITQFAGPTSTLAASVDDPLLDDLLARFPYVTRLRAQMSPEEMTVDPYFTPAPPNAPDVSNVIEMSRYVDPLEYWGCSSRTALSETTLASLPEGRTRIDALKLHLAHPTDWLLSEFDYEGFHYWAFSPQRISRNNVVSFLQQGEPIAPTLLIVESGYPYMYGESDAQRALMISLGLSEDARVPAPERTVPVNLRYWPYTVQYYDNTDENKPNIVMAVLATPEDWAAHGDTYRAMMTYAVSFQYYAHPDLRHTLFLTDPDFRGWGYSDSSDVPHLTVAYPEGWAERTAAGDILIMPESTQEPQRGPLIRLTPIVRFVPEEDQELFYEGACFSLAEEAVRWTVERYGLPPDLKMESLMSDLNFGNYPVFPFQREGRTGTVRFTHRYIVELSMPEADAATYGGTMAMISDSVESSAFACG